MSVVRPEVFSRFDTCNPKMLIVFRYMETIATSQEPVLIEGETGVGKELVVLTLHELGGFSGKFVSINMAGLDELMFNDTLFGHRKGAFTNASQARPGLVESAVGGVLFLDEIGDLGLPSQMKLMRLLQGGEYYPLGDDHPRYSDARVIVATNQPLLGLVRSEKFRKDLYYRLKVHNIEILPLRERPEDVPLLLRRFIFEAATELKKEEPRVGVGLARFLAAGSYPGNIRELRGMVWDAVSVHTEGPLTEKHFRSLVLPFQKRHGPNGDKIRWDQVKPQGFPVTLPTIRQAVALLIGEAIDRSRGNQAEAARMLGISRQALGKRMKKK